MSNFIENYTQLQMAYYRLIRRQPLSNNTDYVEQRIKDLYLISQSPFHREKYEKFVGIK